MTSNYTEFISFPQIFPNNQIDHDIQSNYFDSENVPSYDETSNSFINYLNMLGLPKLSSNDFEIENKVSKEKNLINWMNNIEKKNSEKNEKESDIKFLLKKDNGFSQNDSTELTKKKRKRGKENSKGSKNAKVHNIFSQDNLLRKIQIHYLNFIISFLNNIIKHLNYDDKKFLKLNYELKKNVSKNFFNTLKEKTIGEIITNKISIKYKKHEKNTNDIIYQELKENKVLNNIFEENYLKLFNKFYFKSYKIISLKDYGLDKEFILSNKVKMYKNLLKDNESLGKNYKKYINKCAIKNFLPDAIFIFY